LALNGAFLNQKLHLNDEAMRAWQQLTARNADRERLQAFIKKYLPTEVAQGLLAQIAQLSNADLALAIAELRTVPPYPLTRGANLAVECRDEIPFNDYFSAITAYQRAGLVHDLPANQVVAAEDREMRHIWAQCALFPTGVAAVTQNEAVTISVPVLIFQGGLDTVTPPSWAAAARQTLPNSFYLEFPGQGHGVIQQPLSAASGCPAAIALSFLNDPRHTPDAGCINSVYQIPWLLPR
jgi:pimeloyl-ACP methyl ester carboxylesterase